MGEKSESSSPSDTAQAEASPESQAETAASSGLSQRELRRRWPDFLDYVRDRKPWMMATLQKAAPPRLEENTLTLNYEESIDCAVLKNKTHVLLLTEFALDFFQQPLVLNFHVADAEDCAAEIEDGHDPRRERQALARDPLVLDALEVFNGQVGAVRVGPRFRAALSDPDSRERNNDETGNHS
jgi:DNA polymerase-3 subunit gamma/tau